MDGTSLVIEPCTWEAYKDFVHLCSISVIPYHGGKCWKYTNLAGFIGYNYCFRNSPFWAEYFVELQGKSKKDQLLWANQNIRMLSRVMIVPEFRGRGLAKRLILETILLVGVPFVECMTAEERISRLLVSCGFVEYIAVSGHRLGYYVYCV